MKYATKISLATLNNPCLALLFIVRNQGKNILITGGTGFIGKGLIEKLLRSCPDLNKIYVIVRPKKGKDVHDRVKDIISCPVFSVLKKTLPENLNKIIPIPGDIMELGLGLSQEDRQHLIENIHVFVHCAASVKFNDFLKDAILINLRSAREAAFLVLEMKQLECFMHVSTTYCNIDNKKVVEEVLYPPHGNWNETIATAENCDANILNILSQKYIGVFPNTYTYTKQLSEHCVSDLLAGKVPTIIYRPSIVTATVCDPYQGWLDNLNGPTGLLVVGATGLARIFYGDQTIKSDYAPVDCVVKSMIVALWHKVNFGDKNKLDIYHGSRFMLVGIADIIEVGKRVKWTAPLRRAIWNPNASLTNCYFYYYVNVILFHIIPALFLDLAIKMAGHQPLILRIQKKLYVSIMALRPFTSNEWHFVNTKTWRLLERIPTKEIHDFNFAIMPSTKADIIEYITSSGLYSKEHLLKEGRIVSEKIFVKAQMLHYLDKICHWIFYGLLIWFTFFKIDVIAMIWGTVFNYFDNL